MNLLLITMFSSNPFPHLPSSIDVFPFLPPNSFSIHHEKDDLHFPFISGEYMLHSTINTALPPPVIMENNHVTTIKQQDLVQHQQFLEGLGLQNCDHQDDVLDSFPEKKKIGSSKKHGHSKICTARGPRDRRVRFSIEVAQKFFSLQDLLGFDKASKTLDWLISNSMPAIKGLVEVSSVTHQCKQKFLEVINGGGSDETNAKKKSGTSVANSCTDGKKKKSKRRCKDGFRVNNVARAEARARARERTKEKMQLKKQLDDGLKTLVPELNDGCEYHRGLSPSDSALKSDCWSEIEPQIDYKNIRWKCVMSPESSKQSKDSSFTSI